MPPTYARAANAVNNSITPAGRRLSPRLHQFDAIIDLMLTEPTITLTEIGKRLRRSTPWVSYMVHSDAFRDLYEERRREKNAAIHEEVQGQLASVALKSLSRLDSILETNPQSVNVKAALEIADKTLERMGYGVALPGASAAAVNTQVNVSLSAADFADVQSALRAKEEEVKVLVEGRTSRVPIVAGHSNRHIPEIAHLTEEKGPDLPLDLLLDQMNEIPPLVEMEEEDDDRPRVLGSKG